MAGPAWVPEIEAELAGRTMSIKAKMRFGKEKRKRRDGREYETCGVKGMEGLGYGGEV